jgi:hypothetical protein
MLSSRLVVVALFFAIAWQSASAAAPNPCAGFKWDVSGELAVMQQTPQRVTAALRPGAHVPQLKIGRLYALKLADQGLVTFVAGPAKQKPVTDAQAGLVQFKSGKAGRYRISITSGHWLDIVDGGELVQSVDYQGHAGCERPRKIVEYELPAERQLTLQFSGATDAEVVTAITAVVAQPAG